MITGAIVARAQCECDDLRCERKANAAQKQGKRSASEKQAQRECIANAARTQGKHVANEL